MRECLSSFLHLILPFFIYVLLALLTFSGVFAIDLLSTACLYFHPPWQCLPILDLSKWWNLFLCHSFQHHCFIHLFLYHSVSGIILLLFASLSPLITLFCLTDFLIPIHLFYLNCLILDFEILRMHLRLKWAGRILDHLIFSC